jgi:peptidoglycan/xylan/chitin deacetylase (PgdA/CDA1 family)
MRNIFFIIGLLITTNLTAQVETDTLYVAKYKADKKCAISYTFDDGLAEHYSLVAPALEKLGFRGTFWVNGRTIADTAYQRGYPRMTWKQMREMARKRHEISNQGWVHRNVTKLASEELRYEVEYNSTVIYQNIGVFPRTFCYPGNAKNDSVIVYIERNRIGSRTKQFSVGGKSTRENLDEKIKYLISNGEWGVTMTHGITYGYDHFSDPSIFFDHLKKVKALENEIWIAPFRDVAAYIAEQQNIRLKITKKQKKWIIKPMLTLDKNIFNYPLTMVLRVKKRKKNNSETEWKIFKGRKSGN